MRKESEESRAIISNDKENVARKETFQASILKINILLSSVKAENFAELEIRKKLWHLFRIFIADFDDSESSKLHRDSSPTSDNAGGKFKRESLLLQSFKNSFPRDEKFVMGRRLASTTLPQRLSGKC